ncbi:MAG: hypothetical protein KAY65_09235, partial [Planctomycetes bacterium]|nr:hypothetical protein [Planctomycetota bacterium]
MDLGRDKTVREIVSRLARGGEGVVKVEGTWGSFARMLGVHVSERLGRPILYVCPHIDDADQAADDLHTFGGERVEALAAWEGEEDLADATDEIRAERLKLVSRIASLRLRSGQDCVSRSEAERLITPASVQALCQPVPKPEALETSCLGLQAEREVSPEKVVEWLVDNGFERVERVDLPGQFARRGGIVDIYAPLISGKVLIPAKDMRGQGLPRRCAPRNDEGEADRNNKGGAGRNGKMVDVSGGAEAVRVEFFGDVVESIRAINLDTLRSSEELERISVISAVCGAKEDERELFANILPADTIVVFEEPGTIDEVAQAYLSRAEDASKLYSRADIYEALGRFTQLHI